MRYIIVEKKANDCYVLYDAENKGMCCCTPYTIKQLIEMGHRVDGVKLIPKFSVVPLTKTGAVRTRKEVYDVDLTKRSATTISAGLKPSRAELKKQKEVVALRSATRKSNLKDKKLQELAEEKAKKEAQKLEAVRKKALEFKSNARQVSKCVAVLESISIEGSEYHCHEKCRYVLTAYTSAGLTAMKKLSLDLSMYGHGFYIDPDASKQVKSRGYYRQTIILPFTLEEYDNVQRVAADKVLIEYSNGYSGERIYGYCLSSNSYEPTITDYKGVGSLEEAKSMGMGSVADGGSSMNGYARYFRKLGNLTR